MTETIVVGYIPTPPGVAAFKRAKEEALLRGARLVVVNTGHNGNYASPLFAASEDVDAIDAELGGAGVEYDIQRPTSGLAAADELLRVAEESDATLVVIGIRHRNPVGKLLLGSTAQQVLLDAPCPVLAVKAAT